MKKALDWTDPCRSSASARVPVRPRMCLCALCCASLCASLCVPMRPTRLLLRPVCFPLRPVCFPLRPVRFPCASRCASARVSKRHKTPHCVWAASACFPRASRVLPSSSPPRPHPRASFPRPSASGVSPDFELSKTSGAQNDGARSVRPKRVAASKPTPQRKVKRSRV